MALVHKMMMVGLGLTVALATTVLADNEDVRPIPERRQARLLERFGDQGIDANNDGVLTRDELQAFHAEHELQGLHRGFRGGRGGGLGHRGRMFGPGGHMFGPGGRLGHLLRAVEELQAETSPAWFTIERFADADLDQDGTLSAEEWRSFADGERARAIDQLFNMSPMADTDKDGQVSDQELLALKDAHMTRMRAQMLERHPDADTDGDGTLSDAEFEALQANRLAEILERHPDADLDADGVLSKDEMEAFATERHGPKGGRRGMFGPGHGPLGRRQPPLGSGHGPHGKFRHSPEQILERHPEADTDGDGTLSEEELQAFMESRPRGPRGGDCPNGPGKGRGPLGATP